MADDTDEVFNFSNLEFTREDLVTALNDMVLVLAQRRIRIPLPGHSGRIKDFGARERSMTGFQFLRWNALESQRIFREQNLPTEMIATRCDDGDGRRHGGDGREEGEEEREEE
ncbi:hypothetical protein F511_34694 [Dorcoceras hygrometricum]|uniref:Uncharacterized protein n=1 Tax=Dorcoceras hygrometricum TaxID=472368 RepID=A0A2Z7BN69_9LAMI|nr:hypothetical protein F511_34694 [Dorcoceras hygrometricum]